MNDLPVLMRRNTRLTFFFLSVGFLGMVFRPDWKPVFGGFLMGVAGGYLMSLHLAWKVQAIAAKAATGRRGRFGTFGFVSRAAIGVLAAVISVRYLEFNLPATAVGLLAGPLVTLLLGLFAISRQSGGHSSDERGEKQ
ncbi:ATP synthase subunit I [Cohnella candidum]|uniref:ATP synthase subunit I n=1 Tax=Cohnella candidum TaxID=2674991 RepID=A0A3G3K0Z1_9BACL|nr:ATP synthase subunit I [Cohnella candidum]